MNIKNSLFDRIVENGITVLDLPTNLPAFHNSRYGYFAVFYCGQLLIDTYNLKGNYFKEPDMILKNAYASGVFTRLLFECMSDCDECEKTQSIIKIITNNTFHNEEKMIGILLDTGGDKLNMLYTSSRDLIIQESICLTHQTNTEIKIDGRLDEIMTILYSMFLLGAHTDILKDIKK